MTILVWHFVVQEGYINKPRKFEFASVCANDLRLFQHRIPEWRFFPALRTKAEYQAGHCVQFENDVPRDLTFIVYGAYFADQ